MEDANGIFEVATREEYESVILIGEKVAVALHGHDPGDAMNSIMIALVDLLRGLSVADASDVIDALPQLLRHNIAKAESRNRNPHGIRIVSSK